MTEKPDDLGPRSKRPTLKQVAQLVGVDPSLVSRVVNNAPNASASPETRRRILAAVRSTGYQASVMARGLKMARTWTLGLLLPDLSNPMYAAIVKGAQNAAEELGYGLVLATHVEGSQEELFTRMLQQNRVDGLLVASGVLNDTFMKRIAEGGSGPVVLLNRRVRGVQASVVVDDAAGVATAVEHLATLGHSGIAGLFGPSDIDTTVRRRKGFLDGCAARGVEPLTVEMPTWNAESGYHGGIDLLAGPRPPTAVFASTLAMGIGVLRAARELRVSVPRALSVVALHDNQIADYLSPPLTTVAMPSEEMGAESVRLLVSIIGGQRPRRVVISRAPRLIQRESTARSAIAGR